MSDATLTCPKCDGEMVQGVVVNRFKIGGLLSLGYWLQGRPIRYVWFGTALESPKSRKEQIPVCTYRCRSCGFLEAYARGEFAVK